MHPAPPSADPRTDPRSWPIVVAGGGLPGLAASLALTVACGPAVRVTLIDPAVEREGAANRAYALSPTSVLFLARLGVWGALAGTAQPVTAMRITDSRVGDVVRPDYLRFTADTPLAHILEGRPLAAALRIACREAGVDFAAGSVARFEPDGAIGRAVLGNGDTLRASLLVAADGARSRLRDAAGIAWFAEPYDQQGIVGTLRHETPHRGVAIQHFLPSGPFALLPLADDGGSPPHRSSLVWTERAETVSALLSLSREALQAEVARRAGPEVGPVRLEADLRAFPLGRGRARRSVASRLALVGDAAHEIHPLAGQGLNLGLGDAEALAREIGEAVRLGTDPGGAPVLAAYDSDRRPAVLAMVGVTDGLNRLFSNDRLPLRTLRDLGLGLINRSGAAKEQLMAGAR